MSSVSLAGTSTSVCRIAQVVASTKISSSKSPDTPLSVSPRAEACPCWAGRVAEVVLSAVDLRADSGLDDVGGVEGEEEVAPYENFERNSFSCRDRGALKTESGSEPPKEVAGVISPASCVSCDISSVDLDKTLDCESLALLEMKLSLNTFIFFLGEGPDPSASARPAMASSMESSENNSKSLLDRLL